MSYSSNCVLSEQEILKQLNKVERAYWQAGFDSRAMCEELIALCKKTKSDTLAYAFVLQGRALLAFGELELALYVIKKGVKLLQSIKDYKYLAFAMLWLGSALQINRQHLNAVDAWIKTIELALDLSQLEYAVEAYLNVAFVYHYAGQVEVAELFMKNGLKLAESINSKKLIAKSGIFLVGTLLKSGKSDLALSLIGRIEPHALAHGDLTWLIEICNGYAQCYANKPELAEVFYQSALAMAKYYNLSWAYCLTVINYGEFLRDQGEILQAAPMLLQAQSVLKTAVIGDLDQRLNYLLYLAHREMGDFKSALLILRIYEYQAIHHLTENIGLKGHKMSLSRLDNARGKLTRTHLKFEKLAGWVTPGISLQHLRKFKLRCDCAQATDRIIELTINPSTEAVVEQRIAALLNDYCTMQDLWIFMPSNKYIIYPGKAQFILMDFATKIASAIEAIPWHRYELAARVVKIRLLLASDSMLKQLDVLLQKELDNV